MSEKKKLASLPIEDGMFFPEELRRLHPNHVIYIEKGFVIDLDKL